MPAAQNELQGFFGKSYAFIIGIDEYISTEGGGAKLWPLPTERYNRLSTPGFLLEMTVEEKKKYGLE